MSFRTKYLAVLLALCVPAWTQNLGSIRGTITDPSGAAVPGVSVTALNVNTGLKQSVNTGTDGSYSILYLPVGDYRVGTERAGFRRAETTGVRVDVASVVDVDFRLTVGGVDQTVEVTAATPILETTGSNLGKVVATKAITDLPLFISGGSVRSNLAFVILTPGVIGPANNPRIGGGLLDGQSEQLDGAEANSERRNDPAMNGVSVEGMEEFKVQSSGYSAEYGRTSNGVINWVTKSGTNQPHGSGFLFNRNEVFNARGFTFAPSKRPIVRQWNPGGSFGGPIFIPKVFDGRNKAFFFFAYEKATTRNGQSTALVNAPIDEYLQGDFRRNVDSTGKTFPLYDPFDASGKIIANAADRPRLQCNGVLDVLCPSRIDPTVAKLIALLPHPDDPTKIVNNYRSRSYSTSRSSLPSIKLDYVFNDKHRISYLYSHFFSPATPSINNLEGLPGTGFPSEVMTDYHRLNDDYTLAPNLLNHITIGFNRRTVLEAPGYVSTFPADLARATYAPGTVTPLAPGTSTTYSTSLATWGNSVFTDSRQRTTNIKEQLSWIKGRQTIKFGMEYLTGIYRRLDFNGAYGTVSFSAAGTGNPNIANSGFDFASFLLGTASGGGFRYPSDTAFFWPYYAWYVQDDFKVNNRFTLNIGLRYEIPVPKEERHLHNSNFCPTCPNPAAGGLLGAMQFAGVDGAPNRFGQTRMNAFGPRLGMAYRVGSKTVLRAGGSIYYQPSREDGNADNGIQGFGGTFSSIGSNLSNGVSYLVKDGYTSFATQIAALRPPISSPAVLSANLLNQTPFYYNPTAGRAPYFGDWNFTVDHTLTQSTVLRGSYHATIGNKLLSRQQNQNQLDPKYWGIYGTLLSQPVSSVINNPVVVAAGFKLPYPNFPQNLQLQQALRPYPQYSGIGSDAGGQNDGHMTFHALEASVEHRFDHGLFMLVSYTFAKVISGSNGEDANRTSDGNVQNQYNRRADKAVASQDTPHNLRISYVYELPFGKGKHFLGNAHPAVNAVLGNWKVSAIHTYVSGTPLMITCGQNFFGAGANARCSFAPGATTGAIPLLNPAWTKETASTVPYLNKDAFILPANMTYGDTGRRLSFLRTPWTVQEDLAVIKNFALGEKARLEIRASASNALNRVTFASPNTTQSSAQFGLFTAQGNSPRNIQMGARVSF
ncbi:TonB-dependent receptor [Bryobacter aggregatus]|uniref:TonB-dependent receptor n=1 Tax=Bryobacter aggregatus TaxID=360054 RepID=UPI0004E17962|nr:TonB-dependent receptor [Bryobacter aggregatus]